MFLLMHNESRPALLFIPFEAGQDGVLELVVFLFGNKIYQRLLAILFIGEEVECENRLFYLLLELLVYGV